MIPPHIIDNLLTVGRFFAGFVLIVLAFRAFLKTKTSSMIFLTIGFTLITVGDLFSAVYYIEDEHKYKLLSQAFDMLGLISLIIAVKKTN
jgi:uncharacterized membrane protein